MEEISQLKMQADFVNLSACETGLGKIYGGEGVVGLNQAFLIGGANALSVSLWQVADKSTSTFMTELYKIVETEKCSYKDAMIKVKRNFISGKYDSKYKHPYYWASFVYYGK
jgi:CHAT domain-containing protein